MLDEHKHTSTSRYRENKHRYVMKGSYSGEHGRQEDGPDVADGRHPAAVDSRIPSILQTHLRVHPGRFAFFLGVEGVVLIVPVC